MAPLTPHWIRPSHPEILDVIYSNDPENYTTKSISRINLPPNAVFAKFEFPPCTITDSPTYATVQVGKDLHMNLNSDLVYINHSCEPSVIFDITSQTVRTGPRGLVAGQELTFFYPSTEWSMAQSFKCNCGTLSCLGYITGARGINSAALAGYWLNNHIKLLLEEQKNRPIEITSEKYGEHDKQNFNENILCRPSF